VSDSPKVRSVSLGRRILESNQANPEEIASGLLIREFKDLGCPKLPGFIQNKKARD